MMLRRAKKFKTLICIVVIAKAAYLLDARSKFHEIHCKISLKNKAPRSSHLVR